MTSKQFIERLKAIPKLTKTYYIKGGFGQVLNAARKKKLIEQYKYNKERADKINALDPSTFAFDCCGLVKGVYWGFIGATDKIYGGAVYGSNKLNDVNEKGLLELCTNISDDFTNLIPGEFLYTNKPNGHCGIYIGDGKVIESTPSGSCGVQETALNRIKWQKHGKLSFITDEETPASVTKPEAPKEKPKYYIVKPGDNLSKIAAMYGYKNYIELWKKNPHIKDANLIYPGEKIII